MQTDLPSEQSARRLNRGVFEEMRRLEDEMLLQQETSPAAIFTNHNFYLGSLDLLTFVFERAYLEMCLVGNVFSWEYS